MNWPRPSATWRIHTEFFEWAGQTSKLYGGDDDTSAKMALDRFWVSDNIRKGAAASAVPIAEGLVQRKLI